MSPAPDVGALPAAPRPGGGARAAGREALLALLLLAGGAAALLHETVWFRVLTPVLGAGALTASVVSAGTLLGLALGAAYGGGRAALGTRPLLLWGVAEVLAALGSSAVVGAAGPLRRLVDALPAGAQPAADLLPAVLVTALLALAATPLGASLPAALRALGSAPRSAGAAARRLYGWNTLGAVCGVLAGAGWLLERLGNRGTLLAAAALQGVVALACWVLHARAGTGVEGLRAPAGPGAPAPDLPGDPAPRRSALAAAAALAGGAGLAVQVAWVRRLTPAVGTTMQSFATVLAAYLLAVALGSLLLGPRRGTGGARGAALLLALAALPVALLPPAIAPVARAAAERARGFDGSEWDLLLLRAGSAGLLLVPSTLLGAAALPWLLRAGGLGGAAGARTLGRLLAWNTVGSAAFALGTALAWLPAVGSAAVLRGSAGCYLVAAALLVGRRLGLPLTLVGALLLLQPFVAPMTDEAGRDAVGASFLPEEFALEDAPALFYAEGRATTVVVRDRDGQRELWVEGKIEASSQPTDRLHLTLLGSLPMALHPDPRRVGIVGLGTGRTAQAVAAFGPERFVVLELEPEVVRAAPLFAPEGAGLPAGAQVVIGDARRSLRALGERFDVLTSDPIHPGVAGAAALYAREAYATARERLAPGGLFCQWLPLYQLTVDDVRLALRTFVESFPQAHVFQAGMDLVLVGADAPVRVSEARLRARLAGPAGEPLADLGLRSPGRLLALHLKGPRGVAGFAGPGPVNTDDRLMLEFRAGRAWFTSQAAMAATLLGVGRAPAAALLDAPASAAFQEEVAAGAAFEEGIRAWITGDVARAIEAFDRLAGQDAGDRFAREMREEGRLAHLRDLMQGEEPEPALSLARALAGDGALTDAVRLRAAEALRDLGDLDGARALAREVLARRESPRARRLLSP